ncbi:NADH-quinone oxidoreductase subunit N [Gordonia rhizosphera NBRC 16068]|uniref:NADH-quinone oxidoreductase subunit N n=2 Tax=Gordonia rhizosphera TaxID=83341 RepID=K6WXD3_9ACTN|nr:NADH-quinone oxidoreductase subunit N [Gordonia rhizosphera NBRC 16068]
MGEGMTGELAMTGGVSMGYGALVPEAFLMGGAILTLLVGSYLPLRRQPIVTVVAVAAAIGSAVAAVVAVVADPMARTVFDGTYALDAASTVIRVAAPLATTVVLLLARADLNGSPRESETVTLLLLATLGTVVLAGAHDVMIVITGYLLATVPLYALIGLRTGRLGAEASLKTYLLGALLGVTLMFGAAVLAAVGGGTAYAQLTAGLGDAPKAAVAIGFVAVLAGLLFKVGAVPGHFWVPDAAQGASVSVAAFLTTVPKLGALVAVARLVALVEPVLRADLAVAAFAAATMVLGTFAAFWQNDVRRLLGWSTVSQAGFLLLPAAAIGTAPKALAPLLVYAVFYAITNLALFSTVAALPDRREIPDWRSAGARHPVLVGVVIAGLLSIVGTPPTLVFVGKISAFTAAAAAGLVWLVVVAVVASVASLFYALRWIAPTVRRADADSTDDRAVPLPAVVALTLGVLVVAGGVAAIPILAADLTLAA